MQNRKCPLCANDNSQIINRLYTVKMEIPASWNLPKEYDIVTCPKCGFCFGDTSATRENYDAYYEKHNIYATNPHNEDKIAIYEFLADIYEKYANKSDYIIDMGSGAGEFLIALGKRGFINICGMDTSQTSIDVLYAHGINGFLHSIYEGYDGEKADWLHLGGVLEHLLFPKEAIINARKYLKDDGKISIVVPNIDNILLEDASADYYFNHEHINYFSLRTLIEFMKMNGFSYIRGYKDINSNHDMMGIFQINSSYTLCEVEPDTDGVNKLIEFFEKHIAKIENRRQLINELVASGKPLIIWGCGSLLFSTMYETNLKNANVIAYVDNNIEKQNNMVINGSKVESPDVITQNMLKGDILVFNAFGGNSLAEDIIKRKIENPVTWII